MKVKILNEEIDIRFCMAVELAYEEITGEPFSIDALQKAKNTIALGMAAILTANPKTSITLDRMMYEASGQEVAALNHAIIDSMTEWMAIPKVVADAKATAVKESDESPKN